MKEVRPFFKARYWLGARRAMASRNACTCAWRAANSRGGIRTPHRRPTRSCNPGPCQHRGYCVAQGGDMVPAVPVSFSSRL